MSGFWEVKNIRSVRVEHVCEFCLFKIRPGEEAVYEKGVVNDTFYSRYLHRFCKDLWYQSTDTGFDDTELADPWCCMWEFLRENLGDDLALECMRESKRLLKEDREKV